MCHVMRLDDAQAQCYRITRVKACRQADLEQFSAIQNCTRIALFSQATWQRENSIDLRKRLNGGNIIFGSNGAFAKGYKYRETGKTDVNC